MSDKLKAPTGKWMVTWGIHHRGLGGIDDRDICDRIIRDTESEARQAFSDEKAKLFPGTYAWFANLYDDKGNMTVLYTDLTYS